MSVRDDSHRVAELAETQYGVVSRRQLLDLGLTRSMVETRLRRGALVALHPGVYAVGHRQPVTTVERTLVDLATVLPSEQMSKALREAEHLRVVDVRELREAMRRVRTRKGSGHAVLDAVLLERRRRGTQLTRSVLEDRFLALCKRHGLPRPRMNTHVEGMEVDALWPGHRLAVELDGWARHKDRHAFQRDRDKGNTLTQAGYRVLRFTHDDVVRRPGEIAARVATFLVGA